MDLLLDTCVVRHVREVEKLAVLARERGHRLLVPGLVYAERAFQERRRLGSPPAPRTYDPQVVRDFFARFQGVLQVLPLDDGEADRAAGRLHQRFPTEGAWLEAKRSACRACLNVLPDHPVGDNHPCGAPVDLYLAALASPERPIVTMEGAARWEWAQGREDGSVVNLETAKQRLAGA